MTKAKHSKLRTTVYQLKPARNTEDAEILQFFSKSEEGTRVYSLFNFDEICLYLIPEHGDAALDLSSTDFEIERLSELASTMATLQSRLIRRRESYLKYPGFRLISAGSIKSRKTFSRINRVMRRVGAPLDGETLQHPTLLSGWAPKEDARPKVSKTGASPRIAIVVHIYYEDIWEEIETILKQLRYDFQLIVTVPTDKTPLQERLFTAFPDADIHLIENRGRDVRPFMVLLEQGVLDKFDYVCKIHGKKSVVNGDATLLGKMWRRRTFFDLLAAPGAFEGAIELFEAKPSIGMIGSRVFRRPNADHSEEASWGENRQIVKNLASRMGLTARKLHLDYFCGTMFWVRTDALLPLRNLGLSAEFETETGKVDGTLAHALERAFSLSVRAAGYELAEVDRLEARAPEVSI